MNKKKAIELFVMTLAISSAAAITYLVSSMIHKAREEQCSRHQLQQTVQSNRITLIQSAKLDAPYGAKYITLIRVDNQEYILTPHGGIIKHERNITQQTYLTPHSNTDQIHEAFEYIEEGMKEIRGL